MGMKVLSLVDRIEDVIGKDIYIKGRKIGTIIGESQEHWILEKGKGYIHKLGSSHYDYKAE